MKLSKNQEVKIHSDTNWKIQLVYMTVQVHSSSELIVEHKENQNSLSNQSWLWPYLSNLRVKRMLCSFSLVLEGKIGKKIPESSWLEILKKISTKTLPYQMQDTTPKTY